MSHLGGRLVGPAAVLIDDAHDAHVVLAGLRRVAEEARRNGAPVAHLVELLDTFTWLTQELGFARNRRNQERNAGQRPLLAPAGSDGVQWLAVSETAQLLGLSAQYVRRMAGRGVLGRSHKTIDGQWRIDPEAVDNRSGDVA